MASPLVILNPSLVILSEAKNLTQLRINSATEESHNIEDRFIEEYMGRSFARRAQDDREEDCFRILPL